MKIVDKKVDEIPENKFYGVDVNNKQAVEQEFLRLKKQHKTVTIVVIVALLILGIIFFDFCRVNFMDAKPIFAVEEKVERGTLFSGLGYKVLYCNNGDRYVGSVLYKTCVEQDEVEFTNLIYEKLVNYLKDEKLLNEKKLEELVVNSYIVDEDNKQGGSDYLVNLSYKCKNDSVTCVKTKKEFYDTSNVNLYVRFDKYNDIYAVEYFKNSGAYYDTLVADYTEKVKQYFIDNEKLTVDNLRTFSIKLVENHGKFKFRGTVYAESYLIQVDYLCHDGDNNCVTPVDKEDTEGDYANLSFLASVFIDAEGNILLIGPKQYLDL